MNLPIVITAFNRPDHLSATLESLRACKLADASDLYIFVDGVIAGQDSYRSKLNDVLSAVTGFKSIVIKRRPSNIGLARNVIQAVTEVMSSSIGAIVLEDDMILNEHFLVFMNRSFEHYRTNEYVGCITGYCPPIEPPKMNNYDLFASTRSSTWGWSMKSEDWLSIDWRDAVFERLIEDQQFLVGLSRAGNDRIGLLKAYLKRKLDIWGVRRGAWQVAAQKLTLYPKQSLLKNIGLDGSGINCGISNQLQHRFSSSFCPEIFPDVTAYEPHQVCEDLLFEYYSK